MDIKKVIGIVTGSIGLTALAWLISKDSSSKANNETEEIFCGIPLSDLNELAKQIPHGIKCTLDQSENLVFHYLSKGGHQIFHARMGFDNDGNLINPNGYYPGEYWSMADEFAKQANKLFKFVRPYLK